MPLADGRIPEAGDLFWIDFGSPVGHEQAGRRPSLVLSAREYNERSSLFLVCPISRRDRSWPFQVEISPVGLIQGYALVDQVRAMDPLARFCRFAGKVSNETLTNVRVRLASLLSIPEARRP